MNQNKINEEEFYNDNDTITDDEYYEMLNEKDKLKNKYLYELPDIKVRLLILDTEVCGNKKEVFNIMELSAFEMINGRLTGNEFHSFFKPRSKISLKCAKAHKIPLEAFYYTYSKDRNSYLEFLKFAKNSTIISHNTKYDMQMINKSLKYYKLSSIPSSHFKCSTRIFLEKYSKGFKFSSLRECLEFLKIQYKEKNLHLAKCDAYYLSKIIEKMYEDNTENSNSNNHEINEKEKDGFTDSEIEEIIGKIFEQSLSENKEEKSNDNFIEKKENKG